MPFLFGKKKPSIPSETPLREKQGDKEKKKQSNRLSMVASVLSSRHNKTTAPSPPPAETTRNATPPPSEKSVPPNAADSFHPADDALDALDGPYVWWEGRMYYDDPNTVYPLPIDSLELTRLQHEHEIVRQTLGLFSAPVEPMLRKEGAKVLEMGCAAGFWMREMAMHFPECEFVGLDVSPAVPASDGSGQDVKGKGKSEGGEAEPPVPPNVQYVTANALNGLPFADDTFDFVYQRGMGLAYTTEQWARIMHELQRVTKPGGYVELVEPDMELRRARDVISPPVIDALKSRHLDLGVGRRLGELLQESLEATHTAHRSVPIGRWGGRIGALQKACWLQFWGALAPFVKVQGVNLDLAAVKRRLSAGERVLPYIEYYVAVGRKFDSAQGGGMVRESFVTSRTSLTEEEDDSSKSDPLS
ncbi:uncharacterized protein VTP21DRAFT_9191 [Calcarisporiella thermophila]|uniref:uncharacterized protein n=1 Tax=Calcarisporiella thermophila TaxID=911321 RepID=UPI00374340B0